MATAPNVREGLCFALDYPSLNEAMLAAERVHEHVGVFKIGLELFVRSGPEAVRQVKKLGRQVFLDLKLHDIPATVGSAVSSACALEVDYLTLHASGGPEMLSLAAETAAESEVKLLAVTVLTSMSAAELEAVGVSNSATQQVESLTRTALESGVAGLVCSPLEVAALRSAFGAKPVLVTPGVRPLGSELGDQKRTSTPSEAVRAGSNLLVVGRPIREAPDPAAAARDILSQMEAARA